MKTYTQLTRDKRYQMFMLLTFGARHKDVAEVLGVHKSTISREFRRNCPDGRYNPYRAQRLTNERRAHRPIRRRFRANHWRCIQALLQRQWSPEQIAARLRWEKRFAISAKWIYEHVRRDRAGGGSLWRHLRRRRYRRFFDTRGHIPGRVDIRRRPAIVERRSRLGDWEGDTLLGTTESLGVLSLCERRSRYTLLAKLAPRSATQVKDKLCALLQAYPVRTITFDNGTEFSAHQAIAEQLNAGVYFARPKAPWQRGLNENTNGLLRQYLPKGASLNSVTERDLDHIMQRLNHRPRKALGFKTPYEVMYRTRTELTASLPAVALDR
jgi:IS30 family transposase